MRYDFITKDEQLLQYCQRLQDCSLIAFDTEFVSEDTYRPDLCLIQVAAGGELAIIDSLAINDVGPFWEAIARPGHQTIVHAGRQEIQFCLEAIGHRPHALFDIQVAAALVGMEYPAAYSTLVYRLLGTSLQKGETRTQWRHRPLSERQLDYALQDVVYLEAIFKKLQRQLQDMQRLEWMTDEMDSWQSELERLDLTERWRRVSGTSGLRRRGLGIVRELWQWRENESRRRNMPPKRLLRDDLIVEMARRETSDQRAIRSLRGLERGHLQKYLPDIAAAISRAIQLPESELPTRPHRQERPQLTLLTQFLATALSSLCRSSQIAPGIVGASQDVRDLISYHLKLDDEGEEELPLLARGWRAEIVGRVIDDLLDGRLAIRITDPLSDQPLSFEGDAR